VILGTSTKNTKSKRNDPGWRGKEGGKGGTSGKKIEGKGKPRWKKRSASSQPLRKVPTFAFLAKENKAVCKKKGAMKSRPGAGDYDRSSQIQGNISLGPPSLQLCHEGRETRKSGKPGCLRGGRNESQGWKSNNRQNLFLIRKGPYLYTERKRSR